MRACGMSCGFPRCSSTLHDSQQPCVLLRATRPTGGSKLGMEHTPAQFSDVPASMGLVTVVPVTPSVPTKSAEAPQGKLAPYPRKRRRIKRLKPPRLNRGFVPLCIRPKPRQSLDNLSWESAVFVALFCFDGPSSSPWLRQRSFVGGYLGLC